MFSRPLLGPLTALSAGAVMGSRPGPFLHILPCRSLGDDYHLINRHAFHVTVPYKPNHASSVVLPDRESLIERDSEMSLG